MKEIGGCGKKKELFIKMSSQLNGTANDRIKLNLDHLYCHPIGDTNNFIKTASNQDIFKLLTENKQLKSMLLLHLDLIQEQSDQIILKDKNIAQLKQENESLKEKFERMSQKVRQQRQIKTYSKSGGTGSDNSCDSNRFFDNQTTKKQRDAEIIVDKQQQQQQTSPSSLSDVEQLLNNNSSSASSTAESDEDKCDTQQLITISDNKNLIVGQNANGGNTSIIGVNNGKYINKIILQKIAQPPPLVSIAMQPTINVAASTITTTISPSATIIDDEILPALEPLIKENNDLFDVKPLLMKNILLADDDNDNETFENIQRSQTPEGSEITKKSIKIPAHTIKKRKRISSLSTTMTVDTEKRPCYKPVISTNELYVTREWKAEEIDEEIKQVKKNLLLETPTWVIKECTGLYTIEHTEDLSDETFAKRHQKFEVDERRRKKWDVQRIREQRTIERLKRRHYKKEIAEENEEKSRKENIFTSFFPPASSIKYILVTEEIPVQAFGECIPRLPPSLEFSLPWTTLPHPSHINITENSGFELIKTRTQNRRFRKKPPPLNVATTSDK